MPSKPPKQINNNLHIYTRGKFIGRDFSNAPAFSKRRNNGTYMENVITHRFYARAEEKNMGLETAERFVKSLKSNKSTPAAISDAFLHRSTGREHSICTEMEYEMSEVVKAQNITKEMIVEEIAAIAFCKEEEEGKKIHPAVRLKALDMLAKWAGLYEKDNAQKLAGTSLLQIAFVGADKVDIKSAQLNRVEGTQISEAPSPKLAAMEDDISKKLKDNAAHLLRESNAD